MRRDLRNSIEWIISDGAWRLCINWELPKFFILYSNYFICIRWNRWRTTFWSATRWVNNNFLCCLMILNAMRNALYSFLHKCDLTYELCVAMEWRYVNKDAGNRSFLINKYFEFKMYDYSKSVIYLIKELKKLLL